MGEFGIAFGPTMSVSVLDGDVLALDVAEVEQPLPECRSVRLSRRCRFGREQDTDPRHSPRLLRRGGERRGEEAASQATEERTSVQRGPPPGRIV